MENNNASAFYDIDGGRFKNLLESVRFKSVCVDCSYFDKSKKHSYRCAVPGQCIGVTISDEVKNYLLENVK